jgi:nitroreductase
MNVLEAIGKKRAIRDYASRPIPNEIIRRILNAGRRAQSSRNNQLWHFIAIQQQETLGALARLGDYADHLARAALAVAILTPDPSERISVMFDAGQAAAYMQLAALELGVGSCVVRLHRPEPARTLLGYPEDLHLHYVLAMGYPAVPEAMEAPLKATGRRPLAEVIRFEHW